MLASLSLGEAFFRAARDSAVGTLRGRSFYVGLATESYLPRTLQGGGEILLYPRNADVSSKAGAVCSSTLI
jgi:hypothetical protein